MPKLAQNIRGVGLDIEYIDGVWHLGFGFGSLQPGRSYLPPIEFFVGSRATQSVKLDASITADGLPAPAVGTLTLSVTTETIDISFAELKANTPNQLSLIT